MWLTLIKLLLTMTVLILDNKATSFFWLPGQAGDFLPNFSTWRRPVLLTQQKLAVLVADGKVPLGEEKHILQRCDSLLPWYQHNNRIAVIKSLTRKWSSRLNEDLEWLFTPWIKVGVPCLIYERIPSMGWSARPLCKTAEPTVFRIVTLMEGSHVAT